MKSKMVKIGDVEFTIKPIVFSKRIKLMRIVGDELSNMQIEVGALSTSGTDAKNYIKPMMELFGEKLLPIYALVLDCETKFLEDNLDIETEVELWDTFFEVNNIPFLVEKLRNLKNKVNPKKT